MLEGILEGPSRLPILGGWGLGRVLVKVYLLVKGLGST